MKSRTAANQMDLFQKSLLLATLLAFWIKFNIVLFTYKPYTATKLFFPFFFLVMFAYVIKYWGIKDFFQARIILVFGVGVTFLVPLGYIWHPHDWALYKQFALTLISFLALYFSVILLDKKEKQYVFGACYLFCLIALVYLLAQNQVGWSYEAGHFRETIYYGRPFGILDDPDHSSGLYLMGFYLSIGIGIYLKRFLVMLPLAALFIYVLLASKSAGAIFGLAGSIFVFLALLITLKVLEKKKIKLFPVLLFVWGGLLPAMICFSWLFNNNVAGLADFLLQFKTPRSIIERFDLAIMAKNIFVEYPMTGAGLANDFNPDIQKMYMSADMVYKPQNHIHTSILSALATTGLIGIIPLISLIIYSIHKFAVLLENQVKGKNRLFILIMFTMFMAAQIQSYSLQFLYSISYWFTLLLPFLLEFSLADHARTKNG